MSDQFVFLGPSSKQRPGSQALRSPAAASPARPDQGDAQLPRLREQVKGLAAALEEKASIPVVKEHLELILQLQTDEWREGVTLMMLEGARKTASAR